jgi:hypothetical protein
MGGTSLVTKGILGPIEGDVNFHTVQLPLRIDAVKTEMSILLPDEIKAETNLPDDVKSDIHIESLLTVASIPALDVTAEIKE